MLKIPSFFNMKDLRDVNNFLRDLWTYLKQLDDRKLVYSEAINLVATSDNNKTRVRIDATAAARSFTVSDVLPVGWEAEVVKTDASANAVTINGTGVTFNESALGPVATLSITARFTGYRITHIGGGVFDAEKLS